MTHIEELVRLLADSERRNAELAALVRDIGGEEGRRLLEDHSRECGMTEWHEKFFNTEGNNEKP